MIQKIFACWIWNFGPWKSESLQWLDQNGIQISTLAYRSLSWGTKCENYVRNHSVGSGIHTLESRFQKLIVLSPMGTVGCMCFFCQINDKNDGMTSLTSVMCIVFILAWISLFALLTCWSMTPHSYWMNHLTLWRALMKHNRWWRMGLNGKHCQE